MQPWTTRELVSYTQGNQLVRVANGVDHPPDQKSLVCIGSVTIDLDGKAVIRDGREVRLSPTEYGLLAILATRAGRVIDQRSLLRAVWGISDGHNRNYLRTYIFQLRAKLEADRHHPELIVTVGQRGYRLGAPTVLAYAHGSSGLCDQPRVPRFPRSPLAGN